MATNDDMMDATAGEDLQSGGIHSAQACAGHGIGDGWGVDEWHLDNLESTLELGRALGRKAKPGDCIGLTGVLGAGKTHFAKGIVEGADCREDVTSPTFSLVQEYVGGRMRIYHLDFYRLEIPEDLQSIGWEDMLGDDGLIIVEWADKFPGVMPETTIWVEILPQAGDQRIVRIRHSDGATRRMMEGNS